MKKFFVVLLLTAIVASSLSLFANASESRNELNYEIEGVHHTVIFKGELSAGQQEIIAKRLLGIEVETAEPYGLSCTLFGHKYEESTVKTISHKVRASAPRCLCSVYLVKVCSKCNDTVETLQDQYYISCCPKD